MEMLPIKRWGNSNDLRLPKYIMGYLRTYAEDKVRIIQEEVDDQKRLAIETANIGNELTIEQLFENYTDERDYVVIQNLDEVVGNERW